VIIFSSVRFLSKKVTKPKFFFKKKTETEPKPGQTDRFRFVFLGQKPVQTGLARFFPVWLGFLSFGSVLARFFPVFCRFRFGFFGFLFIKPKPNRTSRFFKKFNRFFFQFGFFGYFFSGFLGLISFPVFLLTPRIYYNNYFNLFFNILKIKSTCPSFDRVLVRVMD
jgi:hypothetical protein